MAVAIDYTIPALSCATTGATRGGISFDQLCRGNDPYYVCDTECLVHITRDDTLQKAEEKLVKKTEDIFSELEIQKDALVKKFYIGKTFVQSKKKRKINPMNPTTWRKGGISSRWGDHRKEDYGKDGMVVIAVITRDQVPHREIDDERIKKTEPVASQELHTLALEQRLLPPPDV